MVEYTTRSFVSFSTPFFCFDQLDHLFNASATRHDIAHVKTSKNKPKTDSRTCVVIIERIAKIYYNNREKLCACLCPLRVVIMYTIIFYANST